MSAMSLNIKPRQPGLSIGHIVVLILVIAVFVFPFYWMLSSSFKNQQDILSPTPKFLFQPTLENYQRAMTRSNVVASIENSLIVALSTTALALILGTPAAFALARFEFTGKRDLWSWFITNRMITPIVLALPLFVLARNLKILDSRLVLILIYLTFNLPIVVWICSDQFRNIPKELDEAATLEGYGSFDIFWRIGIPLAAPGIAVSAILSFVFSWNELLCALVLTREHARTAPVFLTTFMGSAELPWGETMATGILIVLPVIILSLVISRRLIPGLTMGGIRGSRQ